MKAAGRTPQVKGYLNLSIRTTANIASQYHSIARRVLKKVNRIVTPVVTFATIRPAILVDARHATVTLKPARANARPGKPICNIPTEAIHVTTDTHGRPTKWSPSPTA